LVIEKVVLYRVLPELNLRHGQSRHLVSAEGDGAVVGGQVPDAHGAVRVAGGQLIACGREGELRHLRGGRSAVAGPSRLQLPDLA